MTTLSWQTSITAILFPSGQADTQQNKEDSSTLYEVYMLLLEIGRGMPRTITVALDVLQQRNALESPR